MFVLGRASSDVYLTFSMAFLHEGAMYIWSIANWQTSQFWTVAAQTNAQRSVEATDWSSISNLKATDQADPLHNCHSPLLRSGRVRLWFQFWSQSFQSRCQEANQHSVSFLCEKSSKIRRNYLEHIEKHPWFGFKKSWRVSAKEFWEITHWGWFQSLPAQNLLWKLPWGVWEPPSATSLQHLCNMVLVNLLHGCYDLHGFWFPFPTDFHFNKNHCASGVGSTSFVSELFSCRNIRKTPTGWDKSNAHKPVLPTKRCTFLQDRLSLMISSLQDSSVIPSQPISFRHRLVSQGILQRSAWCKQISTDFLGIPDS